jgi:PAS domain S-box-containing protein
MSEKPTYEELKNRIVELEEEVLETKQAKRFFELEHTQLFCIFNNIDEPIYVSDPESYELLFVNEAFKNIWGDSSKQKCYKILQGLDSPCPFCTNNIIFGEKFGKSYIWEFQNKTNNHLYHCIDKAIHWLDGRLVRYEMAIDITELKHTQENLRKSKAIFQDLVESTSSVICIHSEEAGYLFANPAWENFTGYKKEEIYSMRPFDVVHPAMRDEIKALSMSCHGEGHEPQPDEVKIITKSGEIKWLEYVFRLIDYEGSPAILLSGFEITQRKKFAVTLREKEKNLAQQARRLEETNIALKVLVEFREEETKELRERTLANVKRSIYPYIEKLEKSRLNQINKVYLDIIKSNLDNLISPYAKNLFPKFLGLTPTELQIADLIKLGKTTKEIAVLLNVSARAIDFHRNNLRKKLGLKNRKTNLRSYLLSLS